MIKFYDLVCSMIWENCIMLKEFPSVCSENCFLKPGGHTKENCSRIETILVTRSYEIYVLLCQIIIL
jgi:hypothetical protein